MVSTISTYLSAPASTAGRRTTSVGHAEDRAMPEPAIGPPSNFPWTVVPYEYGIELHCPTCHRVSYFDGRTILVDDITDAVDAHRCTVEATIRARRELADG
jgi:hypothetical protein